MAKVRRLNVSRVEGNDANDNNTNEIRPYGEIGLYQGDYLETIQEDRLELLIFDGVRTHEKSKVLSPGIFYGSGADSGDGAGLDTIKLIPDAALHRNFGSYGNDQYIIIDPTVPNHIHLRAGGTIDQSNAELFLGGELNHVRVSDSSNNVSISTDNGQGGTSNWTFNSNGELTFPDLSVQTKAFTEDIAVSSINNTLTAQVGTIISNLTYNLGAGLNLGYVGVGTDWQAVALLGDLTGYTLTAQQLGSTIFTTTIVQMRFDLGGQPAFQTADPLPAFAPDITFTLTSPDYAAPAPAPVEVNVGTNTWAFDNNGSLTFPDLSVQTTAYVSDTGSWTVTPGTANYSFTVPANGTYTMWVRGNIPNGIIAWNATATVTNTNVPVLGQQFAWNYTDAGSPLLITAIPDQFTGTAGTISTVTSYSGTTANTFTFGISNTSGGDVTVEWGYSKV